MSLTSAIASFPPEPETALGHCNLQMIESDVEGCSDEHACCKNVTRRSVGHVLPGFGAQPLGT